MSYLDRIAACNNADLDGLVRFRVEDKNVGWIRPDFAERLLSFGDVFAREDGAITVSRALATPAARTEAVDAILRTLAADGQINGWRDEPYPVGGTYFSGHLMTMERAAIPHFGVRAYGVHVNGYVRGPEGLSMWIGRRAYDKPTFPGLLDNFVAGGQPVGIGLMENVIKEAAEEANVPIELAATARPVGAISYRHRSGGVFKPDVMYCYDLELPADFTPRNTDGELEDFYLWPVGRVVETVSETEEFKANCNLVCIDFFIRHGLIPPEHPDYLEILTGLRQ